MTIATMPRTVYFDTTKLKDIPKMSVQALKEFYARIYPEILTANVSEEVTPTGIKVKFETVALHKG